MSASDFSDSLRDVAMATDFGQNLRNDFFSTMAFRIGFEYRGFDLQVLKGTIFATFCAILVKIGKLTPEITQGVSVPCGTRRQKSTYHTIILASTRPNFTNFSAYVGLCMRIIKLK